MGFIMHKLSNKYGLLIRGCPSFWAILMKIGNVWATVCSALNTVRAMKLSMVLVWIVILIFSKGFGGNTVCFCFMMLELEKKAQFMHILKLNSLKIQKAT